MQIPLDSIYFPAQERARQSYGDVKKLAASLGDNGQLQPILVREFVPDEWPEEDGDFDFVVVDGGRRFVAATLCSKRDIEIPGLSPDHIEAHFKDEISERKALVLEYETNEQRKDFDWQERALFIRRIHETYQDSEDDWSAKDTGKLLDVSHKTVSTYLQLTSDPDLWDAEDVQDADSFRTAYKQWQRLKDKKKREHLAKHEDRLEELKQKGALADVSEADLDELRDTGGVSTEEPETVETGADLPLVSTLDCRHWLADIPDSTFGWIHWDPPYGAEQDGGAFASHKKIADDWTTASRLMRESIPEIFRVLHDGHWLAIWCHPTRVNWLARYLRGHEKSDEGDWCRHCGKPWKQEKLPDVCSNPEWRFWVNPYPCIWYKSNRHSDGHEIKRFLTNQYETFLLACKQDEDDDAILPRSDVGNVFNVPMVERSDRRHVMHKPEKLIRKIIQIISVPGSRGADPSAGSGSVIEAALKSGRRINVCEIDEDYAETCREVARNTVKSLAIEGNDGENSG